jgi:hypothetical protein
MKSSKKTHGWRVWHGYASAIAEAEARYLKDPEGELVEYATTLYSFRNRKWCKEALIGLAPKLFAYAKKFLAGELGFTGKAEKDKADVLSTWMEWMSRQDFSAQEQRNFFKMALDMYDYGASLYDCSSKEPWGDASWCLLELTGARLKLAQGPREKGALHGCLGEIRRNMKGIKDANQRVRVYAKLGMLYRSSYTVTYLIKGWYWGIRAPLVRPWLGKDAPTLWVRLKACVALVRDV